MCDHYLCLRPQYTEMLDLQGLKSMDVQRSQQVYNLKLSTETVQLKVNHSWIQLTNWLIDWLIVWHHKGQPWVLTCISQQDDVFFWLLQFPFLLFSWICFILKESNTSAAYFLDAKHWRRRGVEELHPDCGKGKTEYILVLLLRRGVDSWAEWDQTKSPNKVITCQES